MFQFQPDMIHIVGLGRTASGGCFDGVRILYPLALGRVDVAAIRRHRFE